MLQGPQPIHLLGRSARHLRYYSVGGALGPALATLQQDPDCAQAMHDAQECHWYLMQGVSQLLQLKQSMIVMRDHPLNPAGRQIAIQSERLNFIKESGAGVASLDYSLAAMDLDQSLVDFHDIVEEEL